MKIKNTMGVLILARRRLKGKQVVAIFVNSARLSDILDGFEHL